METINVHRHIVGKEARNIFLLSLKETKYLWQR